MSAVLALPKLADYGDPVCDPRPFPGCLPWCDGHWTGDTIESPGPCWAPELDVQLDPNAPEGKGGVTVLMTHDPKPRRRSDDRRLNVAVFLDRWPDGEDSLELSPVEAVVVAQLLLSAAALASGDVDGSREHAAAARSAAGRSGGAA